MLKILNIGISTLTYQKINKLDKILSEYVNFQIFRFSKLLHTISQSRTIVHSIFQLLLLMPSSRTQQDKPSFLSFLSFLHFSRLAPVSVCYSQDTNKQQKQMAGHVPMTPILKYCMADKNNQANFLLMPGLVLVVVSRRRSLQLGSLQYKFNHRAVFIYLCPALDFHRATTYIHISVLIFQFYSTRASLEIQRTSIHSLYLYFHHGSSPQCPS